MSQPAKFIALDSADGAGKDLQTDLLGQAFHNAGISYVAVHETTGTPDGTVLYKLATEKTEENRWSTFAEACLFSGSRNKTNLRVVQPALARGEWVITNRTPLTTIAYQGYGRQMDSMFISFLRRMQEYAAPRAPDLYIVLDIPSEVGLARKSAQKGAENLDRFEAEGSSLQDRVRHGLLKEAEILDDAAVVIDATHSKADVHRAILKVLNDRYGLALQPVI